MQATKTKGRWAIAFLVAVLAALALALTTPGQVICILFSDTQT